MSISRASSHSLPWQYLTLPFTVTFLVLGNIKRIDFLQDWSSSIIFLSRSTFDTFDLHVCSNAEDGHTCHISVQAHAYVAYFMLFSMCMTLHYLSHVAYLTPISMCMTLHYMSQGECGENKGCQACDSFLAQAEPGAGVGLLAIIYESEKEGYNSNTHSTCNFGSSDTFHRHLLHGESILSWADTSALPWILLLSMSEIGTYHKNRKTQRNL